MVDDEPVVRRLSKAALERYGYTVLLAENGREAIELFREKAPEIAVVLLDMAMPVMGGEEAIRHLRKIRPDIPVIVTSGYSEMVAREHFGTRGVAGFLQKPFTAAELAEKIRAQKGI